MEKLFKAYLDPKMYHERNLGVTNNPDKIADYLTGKDYPETEDFNILSYRDEKLPRYWHCAPSCAREPELRLVS